MIHHGIYCSLLLVFGFVFPTNLPAQTPDPLADAFRNPPRSSAPRTWLHAMSGNMSKAGLTKDLEAIERVGIGGVLLFNVSQGIPKGPIIYASDEHFEMLRHAAAECQRLGLAFGVHNCDGWSSSGGPWITPEQSMKMIVWRDTVIAGGRHRFHPPQPTEREGFYRDIAWLAYPALAGEREDQDNPPYVTTSAPEYPTFALHDQRIDRETRLTADEEGAVYVDYRYDRPKTLRSVMVVFTDRQAEGELLASDDGTTYRKVRSLTKIRTGKGEWNFNDVLEPVTARYFRLRFNREVTLREARLSSLRAIDNQLGQLLMARTEDHRLSLPERVETDAVIDPEKVLRLDLEPDKKGRVRLNLPPGNWTLLRVGYTSTGAFNNPASAEGVGLECDKLSRPAFKTHYEAFVGKLRERTTDLGPDAVQYVEIDSYEMGGQNWTEGMAESFTEEKGYDPLRFLPVLTGRYVESVTSTDAFLLDFRRHVSDLMTRNYFAYFTELARADGMKTYVEPYGFGPLNDLDVGGTTDIPMGEFWMNRPITQVASAVSSAHIYGKPVISAESFTSRPEINWAGHPALAKPSGDLAWTEGINEFMFHRFVHQANTHVEPGMTMNRWGFHFDRTQTWWENAGKDWFTYIARGSYLLRQGLPVTDMLVFIGDGSPNSTFRRDAFTPAIPLSIKYDAVNTDVLRNRLKAENGGLTLPEGSRYGLLLLKNTERMTLPTLRRLVELAEAGVALVGNPPRKLAGYGHSTSDHENFERLRKELAGHLVPEIRWESIYTERLGRKDCVGSDGAAWPFFHRRTASEDIYFVFNPDSSAREAQLDFRVEGKMPEHWDPMTGRTRPIAAFRPVPGGTRLRLALDPLEAAFVVFRRDRPTDLVTVTPDVLREEHDALEFMLDDDGAVKVRSDRPGRYGIKLSDGKVNLIVADVPPALPVKGEWEITFRAEDGYEGLTRTGTLVDWSTYENEKIRHYSGTATYRTSFRLPKHLVTEDIVTTLDLGRVAIAAEVWVNGNRVGVSWQGPYRLDVTPYLRAGENELRIAVTNQWSNRLIGDERFPEHFDGYQLGPHRRPTTRMPAWYTENRPPPDGPRSTFSTASFYTADDPLLPSGLLGPVRLEFQREMTIER